jgi:hypothetical protein
MYVGSVSVEETISTLHFAARARKIKNKPVVQVGLGQIWKTKN